jgi:patatin-related protein
MADKFDIIRRSGRSVEKAAFIDGSTVNDKPFSAVIHALTGRPAHREVTRRLVFVDPDPATSGKRSEGVPGMFRTMLAAMVEIPANEPVREELERLDRLNGRIRILRRVVDLARPQVAEQVEGIIGTWTTRWPTKRKMSRWREQANENAVVNSGFAFESYFRLKILNVVKHLEELLASLGGGGASDIDEDLIEARVSAWALLGLDALRSDAEGTRRRDIEFLRSFDVDYRVRRLRFVIRRLNELYRMPASNGVERKSEDLDRVKILLYAHLENVRERWQRDFYGPEIIASVVALGVRGTSPAGVGEIMRRIGERMALTQLDEEIDEIFVTAAAEFLDREARHELITAYIGFSFFDVLSYPMVQWEDLGELDEILIHRISPNDARAFLAAGLEVKLKGVTLRHFGAFFNRAHREHDYLWGRLTAADRLVDVVLDASGGAQLPPGMDSAGIKAALFARILDAEAPHLKADGKLIERVRARVDAVRNLRG